MRKILPIILLVALVVIAGLYQYGHVSQVQKPLEGNLLKVHFIDVGQGDSTLIQTPDGRTMLVDAGDQDHGDRLVSYLLSKGVRRIDLMVITHSHADHIGGLPSVLEEFGVSKVLDAGFAHGSMAYDTVLRTIESRRIDYTIADDQVRPQLGTQVSIDVLWPPKGYRVESESALNDGSVVLRVRFGAVSVLLTGDIQSEAEGRILADQHELQSTIMKVAHHGSEYSTSNEWLQVVKPEYAVISVGEGNEYGHPAQDTLDHLIAASIRVYRTDMNGTVVFETDGTNVRVNLERGQ